LNFPTHTSIIQVMKPPAAFALALVLAPLAHAQTVKHDIPYAGVDDPKRTLDVYAPAEAKNLPVVFWIHGGGWQVNAA